ncbi:MAG: hypothetical protein ACI841_003911, partial [Planctomycetota bacterium]
GEHVKSCEDFVQRERSLDPAATVSIEYVREREVGAIDMELDLHPKDRRSRTVFGSMLGGQRQNVQDEQGKDAVDMGGVYRSDDAGISWTRVNSLNPRPMYFSQIRVDPSDPMYVYVLGISLYKSSDGGVTFTGDGHGPEVHVDHHALWIDPADGKHIMLGNDGGIYVSWDRMEAWDHHNHVAIGQFYHVSADDREIYNVYGGLQDNGTWGGPSRTLDSSGALNNDWFFVGGGDGFVSDVDPEDPNMVYFESQNGAMGRVETTTGRRAGVGAASQGLRLRFNWKTPFAIGHHNPRTVYAAGSHMLRSHKRGSQMDAISPEITRTAKGSATALSESPMEKDVLYVGTDDGALWMTRSGGLRWTAIIGGPEDRGGRTSMVGMFEAAVRGLDHDANGSLSRDEVPEALSKWFANGDKDDDDELSPEELDGLVEKTARDVRLWDLPRIDDAWMGKWKGELSGENVSKKARKFELVLERGEDGMSGNFNSKGLGRGELEKVVFEREAGTLAFEVEGDEGRLSVAVALAEGQLSGKLTAAGGFISVDLSAELSVRKSKKDKDEDDGTPDGKPLPELVPGPMHIASIEASAFVEGRVYVAIDGHRSDEDAPFIFRSEDYGATWVSIAGELPRGSSRVLREDRTHANLLYLGTEFGAWCSVDRGQNWARMGALPTVAVHEFAQPGGQPEVVAGTHGRSMWIADVSSLRQVSGESAGEEPHLFEPPTAYFWSGGRTVGLAGTRGFEAQNPEEGASLAYYLPERSKVELLIEGLDGEVLKEFEKPAESSGLHRIHWDLRGSRRSDDGELQTSRRLKAGEYVLVLKIAGDRLEQSIEVRELEQE